ncbi:unannotated protein [freshwater metagenome]|uniref:Unannotated protein n=1 Tax=freshwater metagenome TaxID=449393 RepID=A0A6J7REN3_9ZZZZ
MASAIDCGGSCAPIHRVIGIDDVLLSDCRPSVTRAGVEAKSVEYVLCSNAIGHCVRDDLAIRVVANL